MDQNKLKEIVNLIRYYILTTTTEAGSGHPTSSLSAVELMTVLMFNSIFKYDISNPRYHNNDRLIFSKGHASPLYYPLWKIAGGISEEELYTLRKFGSHLEGHPTPEFKFTDVSTGSLGQGLSNGVGMALNAKYIDKLPYQTYVLLGDGETEEGSVWEAAESASYYKLNNLTAIIDCNRLEQVGVSMAGWEIEKYKRKFEAFGWDTILINDGNDLSQVIAAFSKRRTLTDNPVAIIAKTKKGNGFSIFEDKLNWHGKVLTKEELSKALKELDEVDRSINVKLLEPEDLEKNKNEITRKEETPNYRLGEILGVRIAYGKALNEAVLKYPEIISLDAGMKNSTFAQDFQIINPEKYFEMFIAEQNMVSIATALSSLGKIVFVSTFASFLTRAYDQIRMSSYSESNIKFVGSHAGVSIGADGSSQMGLEDIAMFRTLINSVILYPSDPQSLVKCVELASEYKGVVYIRMTRKESPVIYTKEEKLHIGGSKILRESVYDVFTVVGAGVTLHEALKAYEELSKENISIRVVDLYSIKPIDVKTLTKCIRETKGLLVVEDHYQEGGINEAVRSAIGNAKTKVYSLAVNKLPHSGNPDQLLDYEEISYKSIVKTVKDIIYSQN